MNGLQEMVVNESKTEVTHGSLVSLNPSALSLGGVSQLRRYVRVIWKALKNPDIQTSLAPLHQNL